MRIQTVSLPILMLILFSACSRSEPTSTSAGSTAAPQPPTPPSPGVIAGNVPEFSPGSLAIVLLEPKTPTAFPAPAETPVMDQVGQTFGPAVLFVRTGSPVEFRNSDDTLHNVHVTNEDTREGAFNVAIPTGSSYTFTFKADGFYHVGCDIHPAMSAEIISTSSPFATAAGEGGSYEFVDVPPGEYRLTVYNGGRKTQSEVDVKAPPPRGTPSPE